MYMKAAEAYAVAVNEQGVEDNLEKAEQLANSNTHDLKISCYWRRAIHARAALAKAQAPVCRARQKEYLERAETDAANGDREGMEGNLKEALEQAHVACDITHRELMSYHHKRAERVRALLTVEKEFNFNQSRCEKALVRAEECTAQGDREMMNRHLQRSQQLLAKLV